MPPPTQIIADVDLRRAEIMRQINTVAAGIEARVEFDDDLLDEVTNLVEQPAALGRARRLEWSNDEHGLAGPLHYRWEQVSTLLSDLAAAE